MPHVPPPPLQAEKHLLGRWLAQARRQGLLAAVPPEAWHTLSCILSFTCRDGARRFTLDQLALALAVPRADAERRLDDLSRTQWQGQPLATAERSHAGEVVGALPAPADLLLEADDGRLISPPTPEHAVDNQQLPLLPSSPIQTGPGALIQELLGVGLLPEQAERLVTHFPSERIRRQLTWLPGRGARNPAAFLIKAVASDWDAPKAADSAGTEGR